MAGKIARTALGWQLAVLSAVSVLIVSGSACAPAQQPAYYEIFEVSGSPYEMGYQHGEHFSSKIRSLYTLVLDTALLPYLNREQDDIMSFLEEYQKPEYAEGRFSYEMLLQSGKNLEEILEETHPEYVEELEGIADGSGVSYDKILVLNTFVDTMLAFRSVTFFIRQLQAPRVVELSFLGNLDSDGIDNNGDGQTDEEDDGTVKDWLYADNWTTDYGPRSIAAMVEVPTDVRIRIILYDPPGLAGLKDPEDRNPDDVQGVNPESIRIQLDNTVYSSNPASDEYCDCIQTALHGEDDKGLEVIFRPPGGLQSASEVSLILQAGDLAWVGDPPPKHARFMRDERIVFSTKGLGKQPHQIENRGAWDGRSQPPSIGFAVRNSASGDGKLRLAHHFSLLDSNASHKHTVLILHRPDDEKAHVTIGWAGVIWGFSGMNEDGLTYLVNPSDTLNNPLAGQVREQVWMAKLLCTGIPIGLKGRRMLARHSTVAQAQAMLSSEENTFGWNLLIGDRDKNLAAVELDSNVLDDQDDGYQTYGPNSSDSENLDRYGKLFGSVGPDDLRIGSHYQKNIDDIDTTILVFDVRPQRFWSSFYYRSFRSFSVLGEQIEANYGRIERPEIIEILRTPDLIDTRDSMNAVIYEPQDLKLHFAMGQVPAVDGEFLEYDLEAALESGDSQ